MLTVHILLILSAYVLLFAACMAGFAFLLQEWFLKQRRTPLLWEGIPSLDVLEAFIHRMISWAFPLLGAGILVGALWAKREWGRYWGWDPKEIFALATLVIYGAYLFIHHSGWRGRKAVYLSLTGYALVLFTWFLVNGMSPLHKF